MTLESRNHRPAGHVRSALPFGDLFNRLAEGRPASGAALQTRARPADGALQALRDTAQLALQVEFATIPVYLSGMYSISDPASAAYQALRSVVMEEMFHVNQAANLVVALGGQPCFTGVCAPSYPCYLPHANEKTTPFIGLYRASIDVFSNVYAAIETPAPWDAPAQGNRYDTIAQLYRALTDAIDAYPGNPFQAEPAEFRQRTDIYLGKFGGDVILVHDKPSALAGIGQIVRQGEGAVPPDQPLVPREPYGAYNQYGMRTDGTYGPILGTPEELSHFMKFRHVSLDTANFPATRPVVSNPRLGDFTNPDALETTMLFNRHYSVMLRGFEQTFLRSDYDPFFGVVLTMMHEVLPNLANALMSTPAHTDGDAEVGPNAAPTWSWDASAELRELAPAVLRQLERTPVSSPRAAPLESALRGLRKLAVPAHNRNL
jgi:hypothetical protein